MNQPEARRAPAARRPGFDQRSFWTLESSAVAALERLDAREPLREVAKGVPQALQVQAATAALDRLTK